MGEVGGAGEGEGQPGNPERFQGGAQGATPAYPDPTGPPGLSAQYHEGCGPNHACHCRC